MKGVFDELPSAGARAGEGGIGRAGGGSGFAAAEIALELGVVSCGIVKRYAGIAATTPGAPFREGHRGPPEDGRAHARALSPKAPGRGACDGALRDATGQALQIDFGERVVGIGGRKVGEVFLFVATQ